jgi:hypothetical protein
MNGKRSTEKKKPRSVPTRSLPVPRELLTAGIELPPEIELARQQRGEALKAELLLMASAGKFEQAIDRVLSLMADRERDAEQLAWRFVLMTRYQFGRRTERLSKEELGQLLLALGGDEEEAKAQSPQIPMPGEPEQVDEADAGTASDGDGEGDQDAPAGRKKKRKRVRSMKIGPNVERIVAGTSRLPETERTCAICGKVKKVFDHLEHETIKYVPAKIVVEKHLREKGACEDCHKDVTVAPREQAPAVVRKVDATVLAKLVEDKASMSMPLDRQRRELFSMGLDVPYNTLGSYWSYSCDVLEPIAVAVRSNVFGAAIVGADDTHIRTLDKGSKGGSFRGHLWCFVGTDGSPGGPETVAYDYARSWSAEDIRDWFGLIDGFVQCDGYAGYGREFEDDDGATFVAVPPDRRLGCGMHIRSKFHAALLAKDQRAAVALKHFAGVYRIEAECKERGLDAQARGRERRDRSVPILNALDEWVDAVHPKLLPKSPLRRATTYAISQRAFFRRCFQDGRFEIDNGRVERRIRNFAVGRRNFLFTGSERGGQRLATAYTLVENCKLLGVDSFAYLVDVIRRREAGLPLSRLSELTPARWAAEQPRQDRPQ